MLNAHFKPIQQWSGPREQSRKCGTFRADWLNTLDMLEYELGRLRAKDVVIQLEDPEAIKGIRNDGSYRMVSKSYFSSKAGVVLTFESPKGSMSFPCDRYEDWKDNVRAIALSLEALRAVDRYGVTRGNEQYRGWARLEAPGNGNGKMDREQAAAFLGGLRNYPPHIILSWDSERIRQVCRDAKISNHPDHGGQHDIFVKIGQAEEVLCS
jgi:hypothetical protein